MYRSPLQMLLLAFTFVLSVSAAAIDLTPRQDTQTVASMMTMPVCQNYARIANLSIIALNSTYRAAFLRSAPVGTDAASAILDTASPQLPAMKMDANLNTMCGNLTQIAIDGAAANLTNNIVADFTIQPAAGAGLDGYTTPAVVIVIYLVIGVTLMSL